MLKRILVTLLAVSIMVPLTACGGSNKKSASDSSSEGTSDVTSDGSVSGDESSGELISSDASSLESAVSSDGLSSNSPDVSGTPSISRPPKSDVDKTIFIWGSTEDTALQAAVADYEDSHSDVQFTVIPPAQNTIDYFKQQVAAGNQPDIVTLDHVYITSMGRQNTLKDLTQYGAKNIQSKYIQSCWDAVTYKDAVYGLPQNGNTIALMYNKDMLDQTGMAPPTTYDDLVRVGQAMASQDGKTAFTAPFFENADTGRKNWAAFEYFFWLWREGGDILNSDLTAPTFNQQPGVDALNALKDLVDKNVCNGEKYMESDFYAGNVGMIEMGCWSLPTIENSAAAANFGVSLLPTLKDGVKAYSGLGLFAMGVTDACLYPQEAYDFLAYYTTNTEYQVEYAQKNNALPVTEAALSDVNYSSANWQVFIQQYRLSKARPGVASWDQVEAAIADAVSSAIKNGNTKAALDAAASTVQGLLNKENAG